MLKITVVIGMLVFINQFALPASSSIVEHRADGRYICATNVWALRNASGRPIGRNLKKGECIKLVGITKNQTYLKVRLKNKRDLLLKASEMDIALYMMPLPGSEKEDQEESRSLDL